jgi:ribosomal protein S16
MDLNYDELVEKLAMGRIDIDEAAIPLVLEEARKRRDGNVIAHVASWYEDVKDDKARYLELAKESAKKRFGFARKKLAVL